VRRRLGCSNNEKTAIVVSKVWEEPPQ
jgi:hypothetical protein